VHCSVVLSRSFVALLLFVISEGILSTSTIVLLVLKTREGFDIISWEDGANG
jgi:hypothetical protein